MQSDEAIRAAEQAAELRQLDFTGAKPLRIGENGVITLPAAGLLARVIAGADSLHRVEREITVASWLAAEGIPIAEPSGRKPRTPQKVPQTPPALRARTGDTPPRGARTG